MTIAPQLFLQRDSDSVEAYSLAGLEVVVYSQRGPGKTSANEDAAALIPAGDDALVVAVADGLGGQRGGEQASNLTLKILAETIAESCSDPSVLRMAILDGIERANAAVQGMNIGAATTISVIEFHAGMVRPYHVGDSLILMTGQRGRLRYQTVSHSPVGFAVESGLLNEEDALHHEERHFVSNLVGDPHMRIEVGPPLKPSARDTVLLASDGLSDNLRIDEIVSLVRKGPLNDAMLRLACAARQNMQRSPELADGGPCKPDDLTVVLVRQTPAARRMRPAKGGRHRPARVESETAAALV